LYGFAERGTYINELRNTLDILIPWMGNSIMTKIITLFNHKGGVSKTTTTFNVGWKLASEGHRTIMVDADPQCNLTGLVLGYKGPDELNAYYSSGKGPDLKSALYPAFESQPKPIEAVKCIPVDQQDDLFILPGHIGIAEYDATLSLAQQTSQSIVALKNIPGSIHYLIKESAKKMDAEYVLIDVNPSLSALNQNILMTSNYFIIPTTPDFFSVMAINSLAEFIPGWKRWAIEAASLKIFKDATYPFPEPNVKFLGTIVQRYSLRKERPSGYYTKWIKEINTAVEKNLFPALDSNNMTLPRKSYNANLCLSQIPDFTGLITRSQEHQTPVFALTKEQIGGAGVVLDRTTSKRDEFDDIFTELTMKIMRMTNP